MVNNMSSYYFYDGKPKIKLIVKTIILLANKHDISIDSIALIGGWAKKLNSNNCIFPDNIASIFEVESLIGKSDKCEGDVDLLVFVETLHHNWTLVLLDEFNNDIASSEKNGMVDIVLSLPTALRPPGIKLVL